jgi:hypothetical protein
MPRVKAFVLGNGKSRLKFDLNELKSHGKIYGCNGLYRDFTPDVLVATDRPMATEIEKSGYSELNEFWTRHPEYNIGSRKIDINYGFSSGPIAASLAARNEHKPIYLLGFDLVGNNGKVNNVYAGTSNYVSIDHKETFWGNWSQQLLTIMKDQYPNSKFIRYVEPGSFTPSEWLQLKNYSEVNYRDFNRSINNLSWQKQNE